MKKPSQQEVWNKIAPDWYEKKIMPAEHTFDFLKNKTGNILDLGSGAGRHLKKIKKGQMYLVDFSKEMIKLAKEKAKEKNIKAEFSVSRLTKLPFEDNFFDSAIAIASIHCVKGEKNREKVIKELYRVLKPKAEVRIAVWNKDTRRFKNSPKQRYVKWTDKGERYYYLFNEKEIHNLFKKTGFKIKKKFKTQRNIIFTAKK